MYQILDIFTQGASYKARQNCPCLTMVKLEILTIANSY